MDIVRKELTPLDLFPPDTRYDEGTDTVQTWDGTNWLDTPDRDPRNINAFLPPDDRCDGAYRMMLFLQETVQAIIDGVDDNKGDAELALFVLGVLVIIPLIDLLYVLIAALVSALIVVGSSWLHTAFDAFDWDALTCTIYERVNGEGFITDAGLASLETAITADYDTDPASVLNDILAIIGRGGLNDAAALKTDTGDCSACPTTWNHQLTPVEMFGIPYYFDGRNLYNCSNVLSWQGERGQVVDIGGGQLVWGYTAAGGTRGVQVRLTFTLPVGSTLRTLRMWQIRVGNTLTAQLFLNSVRQYCQVSPGTNLIGIPDTEMAVGDGQSIEIVATVDMNNQTTTCHIYYIELGGNGVDPFI